MNAGQSDNSSSHLRVNQGRLEVSRPLHELVTGEILPDLGI
ncbi:MAG: hypothetical protein RL434_688, partial [Pseudomonadota bacterium]